MIFRVPHRKREPDSVVGIVSCYGLDGPGIESRGGGDSPHTSKLALGPTQPPIQWVPGLIPEANRPRHGVDHPTHLVPRLKKEKNYTSTPPYAFVACSRANFTFTFYLTENTVPLLLTPIG